jgi:hypothetical protein
MYKQTNYPSTGIKKVDDMMRRYYKRLSGYQAETSRSQVTIVYHLYEGEDHIKETNFQWPGQFWWIAVKGISPHECKRVVIINRSGEEYEHEYEIGDVVGVELRIVTWSMKYKIHFDLLLDVTKIEFLRYTPPKSVELDREEDCVIRTYEEINGNHSYHPWLIGNMFEGELFNGNLIDLRYENMGIKNIGLKMMSEYGKMKRIKPVMSMPETARIIRQEYLYPNETNYGDGKMRVESTKETKEKIDHLHTIGQMLGMPIQTYEDKKMPIPVYSATGKFRTGKLHCIEEKPCHYEEVK